MSGIAVSLVTAERQRGVIKDNPSLLAGIHLEFQTSTAEGGGVGEETSSKGSQQSVSKGSFLEINPYMQGYAQIGRASGRERV